MEFQPAVYEHAAALIGRTPWEISRNGDLLFEAHAAAWRRYRHCPVVVGIDIYNLEAEAYGAVVAEPAGSAIPAVSAHPCRDVDDVLALPPLDPARDGRLAMVVETARRLVAELPEADVRVPVSGPFSLAAGLLGMQNLLTACCLDSEAAADALLHLVAGQHRFCLAAAEAGVGVSLFESAATPPLISPGQFREVELPALRDLSARCSAAFGRGISCILGGDTEPILDALLETDPAYLICPSETDQAAFLARLAGRQHIMVRVNMDPTAVARGSRDDIAREVVRVFALARPRRNVCLGSGVLPYETPPENVDYVRECLNSLGAGD